MLTLQNYVIFTICQYDILYLQYVNMTYYVILTYRFLLCISCTCMVHSKPGCKKCVDLFKKDQVKM